MEENNNIKQFTHEKILQALLKMDEMHRNNIMYLDFKDIEDFANDKNGIFRDELLNCLDDYINTNIAIKESFLQFAELLESKPDTNTKIKSMLDWYDGLDSKQRLKFNAGLSEKNTLLDSVNSFRYSWNKLLSNGRD
mgnify:FL=1